MNSQKSVLGVALNRTICLAVISASVLSITSCPAQSGPASGLYQIISGSYTECCGIAGAFGYSLPDERQSFVRLTVDAHNLATMTFLGEDTQTVFSTVPCPPSGDINFSFRYGVAFSNNIVFHVDPGPPPDGLYWYYTVSNSANSLWINGTLGIVQSQCADTSTRFDHTNVVAVLMPGPKLAITEFSKDGALLFIQGRAGWTNVIEASTDLLIWTPISTNLMPNTLCPICPYILFRDAASTNLPRRFYRCFEIQ